MELEDLGFERGDFVCLGGGGGLGGEELAVKLDLALFGGREQGAQVLDGVVVGGVEVSGCGDVGFVEVLDFGAVRFVKCV